MMAIIVCIFLFGVVTSNAFNLIKSVSSFRYKSQQLLTIMSSETVPNGAWLPIGCASGLAPLQPVQIEVAGERYAVWKSTDTTLPEDNRWSVMQDACTHRLAPLSEGRVDPLTGCLECPYHGWQFNTKGDCKNIPQLEASKAGAIPTTANKPSLPVKLTGDMIWAYLPLPAGQAAHYPTPPDEIFPELHTFSSWSTRELPYSFDFLVENFMDPAHIPFAHHKLQGTRNDTGDIPQQLLTGLDNTTHCEVAFQDRTRNKARDAVASFIAPCYYHFRSVKGKTRIGLMSLVVPVRPGVCRVFITSPAIPRRLPKWLIHFSTNRFLDSDLWLHEAEVGMRRRFVSSFATSAEEDLNAQMSYIMPTRSDLAIIHFRNWWARHMSLSTVFGPAVNPPRIPIDKQLDRYETHSKHCACCLGVLNNTQAFKAYSPIAVLLVLALTNSLPIRLAAVGVFAFANGIADKLLRGVNGPGRGAKVSSTKFAPEP